MVEKRKTEVMAAKLHRARREIDLFNEKKNESDTKNDTNSNQANDIYPL